MRTVLLANLKEYGANTDADNVTKTICQMVKISTQKPRVAFYDLATKKLDNLGDL